MTQAGRWQESALRFLTMIGQAPEGTYRWADMSARFVRHNDVLTAYRTGRLLVSREQPSPSYLYVCQATLCRIDGAVSSADGKATANVTEMDSGQVVMQIEGTAETVAEGTLSAYQRFHFPLHPEISVPPFQATRAEIAAAAIEVLILIGDSVVEDVEHQTAAMFAAIAPDR